MAIRCRQYATPVDGAPRLRVRSSSPPLDLVDVRRDGLAQRLWREYEGHRPRRNLEEQARESLGAALGGQIAYESSPAAERRISRSNATSRILRIAHVGERGLVSSAGFIAQTSSGPLLVTALHTLAQSRSLGAKEAIISLLFLPDGHHIPLTRVQSALLEADLLFLKLDAHLEAHSSPISPYPAYEGSPISIFQPADLDDLTPGRWSAGTVQGYRDSIGREAEVGTYDSLSDMIITALPSPGASGGPVVDEAGCVVGIVRGWRSAYDERTTSGFASPAQALWEVADLPGLRSRA